MLAVIRGCFLVGDFARQRLPVQCSSFVIFQCDCFLKADVPTLVSQPWPKKRQLSFAECHASTSSSSERPPHISQRMLWIVLTSDSAPPLAEENIGPAAKKKMHTNSSVEIEYVIAQHKIEVGEAHETMCASTAFFVKLLKQGQDSSMLSENATSSGTRNIITRFVDKNLADTSGKQIFGIPPFEIPGKGTGKEEGRSCRRSLAVESLGRSSRRTLNRSDVDLSAPAVPLSPCCLHLILRILLVWVRPCDGTPSTTHTLHDDNRVRTSLHRECGSRPTTGPRTSHHEIEPKPKRLSCDIWRHDSCSHSDL